MAQLYKQSRNTLGGEHSAVENCMFGCREIAGSGVDWPGG